MHEHHFDADELQKQNIAHDRFFEIFIDHGIPTIFDHNDLLIVFLDVGEGLNQHLCPLIRCHSCTPFLMCDSRR